jgi:hypothetical protein
MVATMTANFSEVDKILGAFEKKVERITKIVQAKITLDVFSAVIKRSPVDTGRFRFNWMLTIGEMSLEYDESAGGKLAGGRKRRKVSATTTKAAAAANAASLLDMKIGQSAFITNNTPYGIVLEHGSSDQAPQGVVLVSVQSVVERARRGLSFGVVIT